MAFTLKLRIVPCLSDGVGMGSYSRVGQMKLA